ncbi:MAG: porphobilinogen synthase [Deltaproteobacteria bacterium CG_4_10_14_0_2_um_filter_43_8]|nr:MAG: porphobilinogen synthase [Deltaproteobacteria bacterium CG11_big_fil_rev_8_21_14_0_20_42_23]PJA19893.1 MAG: porphobilinogen synthase [Deltaproteobacteria bacterium CG_4_10_14_0_2_um_filter_43_8]PJC64326.1 MAG: porphobilinogen synthase [Deltaproteobacteria bacterium CG_4_9_14_0_2_um_filter_42_21]
MFPETRMRRLRQTETLRELVAETSLERRQLVWPVFVVSGSKRREEIPSLPGVFHFSPDMLLEEAKKVADRGVKTLLLFGVPLQEKKDELGTFALSEEGPVQQALMLLKKHLPHLTLFTDVCLCAYTSHGHCGVLSEDGQVLNDESLELLASMALSHAEAGATGVSPSDMMDGRIAAIRNKLDANGFVDTLVMSYAAKYASSFYGPFRDAAHSTPSCGDRKTYQMNPANSREALREMQLDVQEGADILMVKPGLPYLDIIAKARKTFDLPIAAYHVSGEYAMVKAAAEKKWIDERAAMLESLMSLKRAGADIIITYYAPYF